MRGMGDRVLGLASFPLSRVTCQPGNKLPNLFLIKSLKRSLFRPDFRRPRNLGHHNQCRIHLTGLSGRRQPARESFLADNQTSFARSEVRYRRNSRVTPSRRAAADTLSPVSRSAAAMSSLVTASSEKPLSGIRQAGLRQPLGGSAAGPPRSAKSSDAPAPKITARSISCASSRTLPRQG